VDRPSNLLADAEAWCRQIKLIRNANSIRA
jgi:hypothetical protein